MSDSGIIHDKVIVEYGLNRRCETSYIQLPSPDGSKRTFVGYDCRPFPMREADGCDKGNKKFCMIWGTAGYFGELGIGFAIVACLAILFGVTTHSRRRRIWKSASVLVALHGEWSKSSVLKSTATQSLGSSFEHHCVCCGDGLVPH